MGRTRVMKTADRITRERKIAVRLKITENAAIQPLTPWNKIHVTFVDTLMFVQIANALKYEPKFEINYFPVDFFLSLFLCTFCLLIDLRKFEGGNGIQNTL